MNYYVVNYLVWLLEMFINNTILIFSLPSKKEISKFKQFVILTAFQIVPFTLKYLYNSNGIIRNIVLAWILFAITLYLHLFHEGALWKKILLPLATSVVGFTAELCTMFALGDRAEEVALTFGKQITFIYLTYHTLFSAVLLLVFMVAWRRIIRIQNFTNWRLMGVSFILPIGQILLIHVINAELLEATVRVHNGFIIGAFASFVADIFLLYVILDQQNKAEMERVLREMETEMILSQAHYEEIERRREDFAKLRHDLNNQLVVLGDLMQNNKNEKAREMLEELNGFIVRTREKEFCADPIVDAVLSEYRSICEEKGISYTCDITISETISINPVKLCSIYSNLLKNAVAAAEKCEDENRKIEVTASTSGNYMNVKVLNGFSEKEPVIQTDRKHYGLEILGQIANEYNGFFEQEVVGNCYESFLSICI